MSISISMRYGSVLLFISPFMRTSIFFFNNPSTTEISTLSLHDALPICVVSNSPEVGWSRGNLRRYQEIGVEEVPPDRKSTRLNSSHLVISYAVFCLKKKKLSSTNPPYT